MNVKSKIKDFRNSADLDTPPERCYNTVPEGAKGNHRLPRECGYCPHKVECYADANNGRGLRIFKYAAGLKYFTRVIATPKVQELAVNE